MQTILLVCALCIGQSVSAVSLRQKDRFDSEGVVSNSLVMPRLADLLKSNPSQMLTTSTSKMTTKAIEPLALGLDGYLILKKSKGLSCDATWEAATSMPLNKCIKANGEYLRYTATSTASATESRYTDSRCETTPNTSESFSLGKCSSNGFSYDYSSTNAPLSPRPFAVVT
jgi:hypothetical protein